MRNSCQTLSFGAQAIRAVLLLAGLVGALATSTTAAVLPAPSTFTRCTATPNAVEDPTACTTSGVLDTASATAIVSPFVSLTAEASSAAFPSLHAASANASVQYSFQVTGGNVGDIVPILIATDLSTTCTESVNSRCEGFAALDINTSAVGFKTLIAVCTDAACGTMATSFSGLLSTFARSGAAGDSLTVRLQAAASGAFTVINESATASADPFIFVDPAFPDASRYSIVVSPGVANSEATPVPEPATVVVLGTVLGALGLLTRGARGRSTRLTPDCALRRQSHSNAGVAQDQTKGSLC